MKRKEWADTHTRSEKYASKHKPKKSLGQNFLNNRHVAEEIVAAGEISKGDSVLEIGAGQGFLTRELLKTDALVYAIETDPDLIAILKESFAEAIAGGQLTLIEDDVRNIDLHALPVKNGEYSIVANIPYYLTGFLFRFFLTAEKQPYSIVFLVQKELADRIARDEKASLFSLSVAAYGTPKYIKTVERGNFTPPPKVTSAILKVGNISRKHFETIDEDFFFSLLHLGFSARRKQLLGNLAKVFARDLLIHTFSTLAIPQKVRGEDLPLEKWLELAYTLQNH